MSVCLFYNLFSWCRAYLLVFFFLSTCRFTLIFLSVCFCLSVLLFLSVLPLSVLFLSLCFAFVSLSCFCLSVLLLSVCHFCLSVTIVCLSDCLFLFFLHTDTKLSEDKAQIACRHSHNPLHGLQHSYIFTATFAHASLLKVKISLFCLPFQSMIRYFHLVAKKKIRSKYT